MKRVGPLGFRALAGAWALPCLLVPALANAAATLVVQTGKQAPSTIYADGDRLRMEMSPDSGPAGPAHGPGAAARAASVVIIDAVGRKMVMVNDRDKTFTEITEDDVKRMKVQMEAMRAQMAERTKNMTPEQRAQMESMMGPRAAQMMNGNTKPAVWKFEPLGQKKTVNGFACEMYRVLLDGAAHEEDCISPWSAHLVDRAAFAGLEKFGESMNENLGAGPGLGMPLFHQYPGLPISRVILLADGSPGEESQVKSIGHGAVPAAKFAPPPGYTKKDLPQVGAGRPRGPGKRPGATSPTP